MKNYINTGWVNYCMLCEYYHNKPTEKPCTGCKHKINPRVPAKELIIAGTRYVRDDKK